VVDVQQHPAYWPCLQCLCPTLTTWVRHGTPDSAESLLLAAVQDAGSAAGSAAAIKSTGEPALFVGMLQVVLGEGLRE